MNDLALRLGKLELVRWRLKLKVYGVRLVEELFLELSLRKSIQP